jgi:CheY-like chemotaxis protein
VNAAQRTHSQLKLNILLADDDRDTVDTLTALLLHEGHVVSAVYRGDHVLEAVRRYRPDVCILDIEMPGQSGYATAQEITASLPPAERPVLLAMSGKWTRPSEKSLAEAVGFYRFFTKPTDPDEFMRFLAQIAVGLERRP